MDLTRQHVPQELSLAFYLLGRSVLLGEMGKQSSRYPYVTSTTRGEGWMSRVAGRYSDDDARILVLEPEVQERPVPGGGQAEQNTGQYHYAEMEGAATSAL